MIKDVITAYCRSNGWRVADERSEHHYAVLVHYFLMDASYQEWCAFRKGRKFTNQYAQYANRVSKAYRNFFMAFKRALTPDQLDWLQDVTDEFEAFIPNHLVYCEVAYMNARSHFMDFETQKESSRIFAVNALAAVAQNFYKLVSPNTRLNEERVDVNIGTVLQWSRVMANKLYLPEEEGITEREQKRFDLAIKTFVNVVREWSEKLSRKEYDDYMMEVGYDKRLSELREKYSAIRTAREKVETIDKGTKEGCDLHMCGRALLSRP